MNLYTAAQQDEQDAYNYYNVPAEEMSPQELADLYTWRDHYQEYPAGYIFH